MSKIKVQRLINADQWGSERIANAFDHKVAFPFEEYPGDLYLESFEIASSGNRLVETEVNLAFALHQALLPLRTASPNIVRDNSFWMWLGLDVCAEAMIERWCGGRKSDGTLKTPNGASYFVAGMSLRAQVRCGVKRLWIAAETSQRCEGDYSHVHSLLVNRDIFVGIFERTCGLDAELAVELATQLQEITKEDDRRRVLTALQVVLSTVAIELLNRREKADLVKFVIDEFSSSGLKVLGE